MHLQLSFRFSRDMSFRGIPIAYRLTIQKKVAYDCKKILVDGNRRGSMSISRRKFLANASLASVVLVTTGSAEAQANLACYDLAKLPLAQRNMRRSVGFVDPAPDQTKKCGTCAFFVKTRESCGSCQILSGGPTAQSAFCTSFAAKSS